MTGDQIHNLVIYPDLGSNSQPFGAQDDAHPTEPLQVGYMYLILASKLMESIVPKEIILKLKDYQALP